MNNAMGKPKKPRNRVGCRELVSLSYTELRLLHTECSTNAACCDDKKLSDEYAALERKFSKALAKLEANVRHEPRDL